jgi:hypothetical protein
MRAALRLAQALRSHTQVNGVYEIEVGNRAMKHELTSDADAVVLTSPIDHGILPSQNAGVVQW